MSSIKKIEDILFQKSFLSADKPYNNLVTKHFRRLTSNKRKMLLHSTNCAALQIITYSPFLSKTISLHFRHKQKGDDFLIKRLLFA